MIQQFAKMDPHDPEWLRYKLTVVECRAMKNIAAGLVASAAAQDRLRGVTREISDFAARELKVTVQNAAAETRQLLEDVQANLHDAIAGEVILKSYTEETRAQFGVVIGQIMDMQLRRVLEISQAKMESWVAGKLHHSVRLAEGALGDVTRGFRVRLFGAWSGLLRSVFAAGLVAGASLLVQLLEQPAVVPAEPNIPQSVVIKRFPSKGSRTSIGSVRHRTTKSNAVTKPDDPKPAIALAGPRGAKIVMVPAEQVRREGEQAAQPEVRRPRVPASGLTGRLAFEALF